MRFIEWTLNEIDEDASAKLAQECNMCPVLADILVARGVTSKEEMEKRYADRPLSSPYTLKDMDKAVERIGTAIEQGERIAVYGDYDADGITAVTVLVTHLQNSGADILYAIPDREEDGYGLTKNVVDRMNDAGVELIITVDNGITAIEEVAYAKELGIDVVITDHHKPKEILPDAVAVVNPQREDCESEFKELAGVGVAFKLCCALEGCECEELLEFYADLVTIGTIADVMPLVKENRLIVKKGLEILNESNNIGINALIEVSNAFHGEITAETVAFTLVPRINACGRLGKATLALELLLSDDPNEAAELAKALCELNCERQEIEAKILDDVLAYLSAHPEITDERVMIVSGEGWHPGVIGIVCSRLVERYGKPCVLIVEEDGVCKGSGRSVWGFSLYDALAACEDVLENFGGHTQAAGVSLKKENIPALRKRINEYAKEHFPSMPHMKVCIDRQIDLDELTLDTVDVLSVLAPFGLDNPKPRFVIRDVLIDAIYPLHENRHIKLRLRSGDRVVYAVYFGMSPDRFEYQVGDLVDVAVNIGSNEYNGEIRVSTKISQLRVNGIDDSKIIESLEIYLKIRRGEMEDTNPYLPTREEVGLIYKGIAEGRLRHTSVLRVSKMLPEQMELYKLLLSLSILKEMGVITLTGCGDLFTAETVPGAKADYQKSEIVNALKENRKGIKLWL